MQIMPRMGLLVVTLALPVGAVLASHVVGEQPGRTIPTEVRIGESSGGAGGPGTSTPRSAVTVRPVVVAEPSASPTTTGPSSPAHIAEPPAESQPAQPDSPGEDGSDQSAKSKASKTRAPPVVPSRFPPSRSTVATPSGHGLDG